MSANQSQIQESQTNNDDGAENYDQTDQSPPFGTNIANPWKWNAKNEVNIIVDDDFAYSIVDETLKPKNSPDLNFCDVAMYNAWVNIGNVGLSSSPMIN